MGRYYKVMVTNSTNEHRISFMFISTFLDGLSSWWETFPAYLYLPPFKEKNFFLLSNSINTLCEKKPERNIANVQVIIISTENRMLLQFILAHLSPLCSPNQPHLC